MSTQADQIFSAIFASSAVKRDFMLDKLAGEEQRYEELMRLLGTTEVQSDPSAFRKHAKALAELEPLVATLPRLQGRRTRPRRR